MTVQELIDELSDMNPNSEVRWAAQPAWPFEYSIDSIVNVVENELKDEEDYDEDAPIPDSPKGDDVVYLVEGTQLRYLPGYVCKAIGWKE